MSENLFDMTKAAVHFAAAFERDMTAMRKVMGLPDPSTLSYVGRRCGWYPEKPKRQRKR